MARLVEQRLGTARTGLEWQRRRGKRWSGRDWAGGVWWRRRDEDGHGADWSGWLGRYRQGADWQCRHGKLWRGEIRNSWAWPGTAGVVGLDWPGRVGYGRDRIGRRGERRLGLEG